MMATEREFEGKDLAEALEMASRAMGIAEPDLHYRIVEQGRRGLFGLGAKSVRIRVMPPVEQPPDPLTDENLTLSREVPAKPPTRKNKSKKRSAKRTPAPAGDPAAIESTVQRMFELMGLELRVRAEAVDGGVAVELSGPDQKLLKQKDGELISALQFLLNRMARRAWPDSGRIQLGSDGQRRGRDGDVVALTREVAQQVERTGRAKRLHPMNAYERRLVHVTVREYGSLGSRSEGNGHLKRVRIFKQQ